MEKKKRRYGKYPSVAKRNVWTGYRREDIFYRIDPHVRYLKPIRRKTKVKGKEYIHYVISTTVPEEWKHGVKVIIEPLKFTEKFDTINQVKEIRQSARDLRELGPEFRKELEEYLKERTAEADRDDFYHKVYEIVEKWREREKKKE